MKNMFKLKHLLLLAALFPFVLLNIGSAIAAKGGVPNGKPFQAIQSQILSIETGVEDLQAQIDQLVTDTTNLAERIAINEEFIAALQNDNLLIIERLEAIEYESQLLGEKVDANSQEIQGLAANYSLNSAKITSLEGQITDLENEMEGKQDVLLSQCPEGFAFREIQPDGSVTCQSMEITEENGDVTMTRTRILSTTILNKAIRTCKTFFVTCLDWSPWGYDSSRVKATCPAGYMATGSSHAVYEPSSTGYTGGQEPDIINVLINTWPSAFTESVVVSAKSFSTTTDYEIIAIVNCLKVE